MTERRDGDLAGLDVDAMAIDPTSYLTSLQELAGLLLVEVTLDEVLEHVLVLTARAVEASVAVSVTVVDDDGAHTTAAASSDAARTVDDAQYAFDEGPCVEALRTGEEQRFDDLTDLERWPRFREEALALGFGSVLAVPLRAGESTVGCLNVFAARRAGLTEEDREVARRIAAPVAAALANARAHGRIHRIAERLQAALETRAVIERARGVLMAHAGCSPDEAGARLQAAAETTGRPLGDVAEDLLRRRDELPEAVRLTARHDGGGRPAGAGSGSAGPGAS